MTAAFLRKGLYCKLNLLFRSMIIHTHKLLSGTGICTLAYLEESHVVSVEYPKERESQMSFVLYFPNTLF